MWKIHASLVTWRNDIFACYSWHKSESMYYVLYKVMLAECVWPSALIWCVAGHRFLSNLPLSLVVASAYVKNYMEKQQVRTERHQRVEKVGVVPPLLSCCSQSVLFGLNICLSPLTCDQNYILVIQSFEVHNLAILEHLACCNCSSVRWLFSSERSQKHAELQPLSSIICSYQAR